MRELTRAYCYLEAVKALLSDTHVLLHELNNQYNSRKELAQLLSEIMQSLSRLHVDVTNVQAKIKRLKGLTVTQQ